MEPKYKRIVLKLSGEALGGEEGYGIDPTVVFNIANDIQDIVNLGALLLWLAEEIFGGEPQVVLKAWSAVKLIIWVC